MHIEQILSSPITWIIVAAASEVIALSPLRDNSLLQLIFTALRSLKAESKKH